MSEASGARAWVERLRAQSPLAFSCFAIASAFTVYFSMYAFRKPFAAGTYEGWTVVGINYKVLLVLTQVAGYALSKFVGIRVVSGMPARYRIVTIVGLIATAELALYFFAIIPAPYNWPCLFLNGLPLGMVWGLVFSFLEGRRSTEMLGAGLCASFILASGVVKSVGKWLMLEHQVPEFWMPVMTGLLFVPPLVLGLIGLSFLPPPDDRDEVARAPRPAMNRDDRRALLRDHGLGILILVAIYSLLNAYRDFRDNFAAEIWEDLGYGEVSAVFTYSEVPSAILVLVATGLGVLIRDNRRAFRASLGTILLGAATLAFVTSSFQSGALPGEWWFTLVGIGMYVPYIAFHVMVFERLIAVLRRPANVGFLLYLCDSFGYLGSVGLMLYQNFGAPELSWVDFFVMASYGMAGASVLLVLAAAYVFRSVLTRPETTTGSHE